MARRRWPLPTSALVVVGLALALVDPTHLNVRPLVVGAILIGSTPGRDPWMAPTRLPALVESGASWLVSNHSLAAMKATAGEWEFEIRPLRTGRSAWLPARYRGELELTRPRSAIPARAAPVADRLDLLLPGGLRSTDVAVHGHAGLSTGCEGLCEFAVFVSVTADGRFAGTAPVPAGVRISSVALNGSVPALHWLALEPGASEREVVAEAVAVSRSLGDWSSDAEPIHAWLRRDASPLAVNGSGAAGQPFGSPGLLIALASSPIPDVAGTVTTVGYLAIRGVGPADEPWEMILSGVGAFDGAARRR